MDLEEGGDEVKDGSGCPCCVSLMSYISWADSWIGKEKRLEIEADVRPDRDDAVHVHHNRLFKL